MRRLRVELLVEPEDGVTPVIRDIDLARRSVEIAIFRSNRPELERALANAVARGVSVSALIASTSRKGKKKLRKLETRLLAAGVTVARTAGDLVRYHEKFLIIDRRKLYLLAFNFTHADIEDSRSFGIVTTNRRVVQEAVKLFEADMKRQPYKADLAALAVSPLNARSELASLIRRAQKELLIYDPAVSDPAMIRLLEERAAAGVTVKIIGRLARESPGLDVRKMRYLRLHTRTIIRDGHQAFVGSQSLRAMELDARRELGIIFHDAKIVNRLRATFCKDWELAEQSAPGAAMEDVA